MGNLEIRTVVVGALQTNCYLLKNKTTQEILIVDPGDDAVRIEQQIAQCDGKVAGILLTHGHYDHTLAAEELRSFYHVDIYAPKSEEKLLLSPAQNMSGGWRSKPYSLAADHFLEDGQMLSLAGFSMEVLHTPGHTVGSSCYYLEEEEVLLSGDTLFAGSMGRTDLPTGDTRQMEHSLQRLAQIMPERVRVYPGHGSSTDIGYEKMYNPYMR